MIRQTNRRACWYLALASVCIATPQIVLAAAEAALGAGPTIHLERHEVDIEVDGRLDEPVWQDLPFHGDFYLTNPDTLARPLHETRVRLFYSSKGLHVGVDADQPPETLIGRLSGRDVLMPGRDWIHISLDTSGTGRYGFFFEINLGDSITDGTLLPERQMSFDWDGPWRGATHRTDTGWSAEFMIPWGTVAMPQADAERRIGIYVARSMAYRDEWVGWPALPMTKPEFLSALQSLALSGVNPKRQYNFYPYASVTRDELKGDTELKVGADFFWRPSSNLQLNATLNPDFGAVESDDVIINLSATETFFPEKRLFFLEGQQIFNATPRADTRGFGIGNRGSPYTMVNTRRIGGKPEFPDVAIDSAVEGLDLIQPVELLGAIKATGQIGAFRYGVMGAFEDDARFRVTDADGLMRIVEHGGNDYGTARVLWEDNTGGTYRALGILTTAVVKNVPGDAYATGVDWHYYTPNAKLKIDGQAFSSDIDGVGRGYGGFSDFQYSHRKGVLTRLGLEYLDEKVDLNDLGFLDRNNAWQVRVAHGRTRSDLSFARQNRFDIRGGVRHNLQGRMVRTGMLITDMLTLNSLHRVSFGAGFRPAQYDDLNSFGSGTFRIKRTLSANIGFNSDVSKPLSVHAMIGTTGEDLGGQSWQVGGGINWQPSDRINLGLKVNYMDRDGWLLHTEDRNMTTFQAKQFSPSVNAEYFISAKQQLRVSLQWIGIKAREDKFYSIPDRPGSPIEVAKPVGPSDDFSVSRLSFQARYRWELAPLSDLFIVYTRLANKGDRLLDEDFAEVFENGWNDPISNLFIVKLRYRLGS